MGYLCGPKMGAACAGQDGRGVWVGQDGFHMGGFKMEAAWAGQDGFRMGRAKMGAAKRG